MVILAIALTALSCITSATAVNEELLQHALESSRKAIGVPGAGASVFVNGVPVWVGVSGFISDEEKMIVDEETLFVLASTTKTFTAAMIMKLVDQGKISLKTTIESFYPELTNAAKITVEMLLRHSSGLASYEEYLDIDDPEKFHTREEIIAAVAGRRAVHPPGAEHTYSNTGYVVLGGIIASVSKGSLESFLQTAIVEPAHLGDVSFGDPARSRDPAHPHELTRSGAKDLWVRGVGVPRDVWGPAFADGGISCNSRDLARFGDALLISGKIVSAASLAEMMRVEDDYGMSVFELEWAGADWKGNSGSYGGFESEVWADLQRGVTIAVTANGTGKKEVAMPIWEAVADAYADNLQLIDLLQ